MKLQFIPIDYDYFDFQGKNYAKIIGRDSSGKRICIIDSCPVYLWAILKNNLPKTKIVKLVNKISKIKLDIKARKTRVEGVEIHEKNFLGKKVQALKVFATNYKDLHDIASQLHMNEIEKRRGYDLGYITHYIIEKKLNPLTWYEIQGEVLNNSQEFGGIDMSLDVDMVVKVENISPIISATNINHIKKNSPDNKTSLAEDSSKAESGANKRASASQSFTPKILAFDIETDEIKIGEGEILMISLYGNDGTKKVITWKGKNEKDEKNLTISPEAIRNRSTTKKGKLSKETARCLLVEYVKDESELIEKFIEQIKEISPDFLVGYFSDGFDLPYIKARAQKYNIKLNLGIDNTQVKFSRGNSLRAKINGIVHIDILKFIKTVYAQYMKSETLSLNEVAKEFLNDTKKQFNHKHSSQVENWKQYYEYNLHDSKLTLQLFEKFWPDMLEFSKIIKEPIFDLSRAGLSKYTEKYILHNLKRFNEIPQKRPSYNESAERRALGGVKGAFVKDTKPGLYENLAIFDFTSMHTSIIISHNISSSTLLEKKEKNAFESPEIETKQGVEKYYFSKKPGFFPELLKEIFKLRKKFKQEYKENPDTITKARSNAFKVLSASAHGYIGFFGARYYSHKASATILAFVRKFNKQTIDKVEKAGYKVIFGDSVSGDTKIIIKEKGKIKEVPIKTLFLKTDQKSQTDKEYNLKKNIKVLTIDEKGNSVFKPIIYVMRHKCKKKMFKIHFTNNWNIDVTEDHSLIGYQTKKFNQCNENKKNPLKRLIEIKPEEIKRKANTIICMKKIPLERIQSKNYSKKLYEFLGFFIGDGSFGRNKQQRLNKDYTIKISTGLDKEEILKKLIIPLQKKRYIKSYWESKTRKGDISINGLKLMRILSEHFKENNKKIVPGWMFEEQKENICAFLRGLFSADRTVMLRQNSPIIKFTSIDNEIIQKVRKLLYRVGIANSTFQKNKPNFYKTKNKTYSTNSFSKNIIIKNKQDFAKKIGFLIERKNKRANIKTKNQQKKSIKNFEFEIQSVKKIEEIKKPKYVYDIEVEDTHRFFANNVLVHNTDSVGFLLKNKKQKDIEKLLKKLNKELPGVMHLELEGFFKRGLWVTTRAGKIGAKKKYALIDKNNKIKIRGFETVRRDWCQLARQTQNKIIKLILEKGDEKKALEHLKKVIKKIKNREINKEDLIIKTQLKKPLSEYKAIGPHVIAAQKMKEQEIPVSQGNIVEYYIAETPKRKKQTKLIREKVKLPHESGKYNIEYYLKRQILPAVENIFQIFDINLKEIIEGKKQDKLNKWF